MKTIIGVTQSGRFSPSIGAIASEFFGRVSKDNNDTDEILWINFPSKKMAAEFVHTINLMCVDKDKNIFK